MLTVQAPGRGQQNDAQTPLMSSTIGPLNLGVSTQLNPAPEKPAVIYFDVYRGLQATLAAETHYLSDTSSGSDPAPRSSHSASILAPLNTESCSRQPENSPRYPGLRYV